MSRAYFLPFIVLCLGYPSVAIGADAVKDAPAMNEMIGTVQSLDIDNRVIHLQTDNGFNVQFTYDRNTVCKGIGVPKEVSDLAYKDQVIIRYAGRELIAREIEKRSLQPAMASSSETLPAN